MERKAHNSLNEAALEVQRQTHEGEESLQEKGLQRTLRKAETGNLSRAEARKEIERQKRRKSEGGPYAKSYKDFDIDPDDLEASYGERPPLQGRRGSAKGLEVHGEEGEEYVNRPPTGGKKVNVRKIKQAWIDSQKTPMARRKAQKRIDKPMTSRSNIGRPDWNKPGPDPDTFAGLSKKARSGKAGHLAPKYDHHHTWYDHVEYDEVEPMVLEYFENYFGDNLNEDTFTEDIMEAVYDLIDLTEAVLEAVGVLSHVEYDGASLV